MARSFAEVASGLRGSEDAPYLAVLEYVQQAHTKGLEKLTDTVVELSKTQAVMASTMAAIAANQAATENRVADGSKTMAEARGAMRLILWMFPSSVVLMGAIFWVTRLPH